MLKRGFKTWCENTAITYRKELDLKKNDPLCPHNLADHLKVKIFSPDQLNNLSQEDLNQLLVTEASAWSAATLSNNKCHIIIFNSAHAPTRQHNDIMHELAHIIIGHKPQMVHHNEEIGLFLRQYDKTQEEEADCLAATLLLPRDALINIKFSRLPLRAASKKYGTSQKLLEMRLNTSGANKIYKRKTK